LGTINQNKSKDGIADMLPVTREQMNLLAHLWHYTVANDAADLLTSLVAKF